MSTHRLGRRASRSFLLVVLSSLSTTLVSDPLDQKDRIPHQSLPISFSIRPFHGKSQLDRMLQDRPQMAQFLKGDYLSMITDNDRIAKWAAEQFEGKNAKQPIYWDQGTPGQGRDSDWGGGRGGDPLTIRIAQCDKLGPFPEARFEQAWRVLAFEFQNVTSLPELLNIDARALEGHLDRDSFIRAYARCEWQNLKHLDVFYQQVWLPWCKDRDFPTDSKIWEVPFLDDFEKWYSSYKDLNDYPYNVFGPYYDSLIEWGHLQKRQSGASSHKKPRSAEPSAK